MHKVLLCVLSYNRQPFTKRCLETFFAGTDEPVEMVIVDQGSGEPTVKFCQSVDGKTTKNGSTIKVIYLPENIGIPRGLNKALELRKPEQHFFKLDNDVIIPNDCKNWLTAMIDIAENHRYKDPLEILGLSPFDWNRPRDQRWNIRQTVLENGHQYEIEQVPHNLLEMGLFISANMANKVGNFNERGSKYGYEGAWYQQRANCNRAYFHNCHAIHGDDLSLLESNVHADLKRHILTGGKDSQYTIDTYSEDLSDLSIDFL